MAILTSGDNNTHASAYKDRRRRREYLVSEKETSPALL